MASEEIQIDPRSPETLKMGVLEQICSILSISEHPDENRWRSLLFQLARDSPALYHAIDVLVAFEVSQERPSFRVVGMEHKMRSIHFLYPKLRVLDEMQLETALSTSSVLDFIGRWWGVSPDSHDSTRFGHLKGANLLLRMVVSLGVDGDPPVNGVNVLLFTFLYSTWY
jgi:hypothetical protein